MVATGGEYIVPQLVSNRFAHRAKEPGVILEVVENDFVKVKYNSGITEYIDITPRLSTTKRASYINLSMDTLPVGSKFKANELLAWVGSSFNGLAYTSGRNLKMAIMDYLGHSHEDGYVVSEKTSQKFETELVNEVNAIVPLSTKITKIVLDKRETEPGEVLLEFVYAGDLDDYITSQHLLDEISEETEEALYSHVQNKIQIKSPGGIISDIRIYINNKKSLDPTVIEAWNKIVDDLKRKRRRYAYGKTSQKEKLEAIDNLDMSQLKTGTHKYRMFEFEGARIVFYIRHDKVRNTGDKLANRYGAKGIISKVIPENKVPYGEYTKDIDIFISPLGVLGRKNFSIIKELYIGKILYFLPDILSKKALDKRATTNSLKNIIYNVYNYLDPSKTKKYATHVKTNISNIPDNKFRSLILHKEFVFNFIIEPFNNIPIRSIITCANYLDIPLDEHVYIPELDTWTKNPVPVGIQFINALEQFSEDYESIRSTGGYKSLTGQPQKGRANMGGQSIGNLDIWSLISYDTPHILEELMTVRSDDFNSKRIVEVGIMQNGEVDMPENTGDATTKELFNIHMIAMGLKV